MQNKQFSRPSLNLLAIFAIVVAVDTGLSIETCVAQRRQGVFKKPSEQPDKDAPANKPAAPQPSPGGVGAATPDSPAAITSKWFVRGTPRSPKRS